MPSRTDPTVFTDVDGITAGLNNLAEADTLTDYQGFYGLYREAKTKTVSGSTTTTLDISGVVEHSVDPAVNHVTLHEFEVPEGTTAVSARIDWADGGQDIDLYIYDATGKQVGASATDNSQGAYEEAHAQSSDPMAPGKFVTKLSADRSTR